MFNAAAVSFVAARPSIALTTCDSAEAQSRKATLNFRTDSLENKVKTKI